MSMMIVFMAVVCDMGTCVIPFKGWQLALCNTFNKISGTTINYSIFIGVALLVGTLLILLMALSMKYVFKVDFSKLDNFDASVLRSKDQTKLNYVQKSYFFTFILVIALTLASTIFPASWPIIKFLQILSANGIFALAVVLLCAVKIEGKPLLHFGKVAKEGIKWEVIFICASVIPLANALTSDKTGIVQLCADLFNPFFAGKSALVVLILLVLFTLIGTNIGSNTGVALLFIPIAVPLSIQANLAIPVIGLAVIYTACMGEMLPGSSAVAAVAYSNEWIKPKDMIKYAGWASLLYAIVAIPVFLVLNSLMAG